MTTARTLRSLQTWMQSELTRSHASSEQAIARVVLPSRRLTSSERLALYADMMRLRFVDCLRQDFPGVAHAVGDERFDELCNAYVERHPSRHYSLNMLGARFADFLRDEAGLRKQRVFLAELARLERFVQEAFDSAPSTPLHASELLAVPQAKLAKLRIELAPGVRLLATTYPVDEYLQAVYGVRCLSTGLQPGGKTPDSVPARRRAWTLVYRHEFVVWRARIDRERFTLLSALQRGATLGNALESCAALPGVDAARLGASISAWFEAWTADGLFVASTESGVFPPG